MDARATPTGPGEPWRILLLPQPERICLVYRIDTFGVHQIGLYKLEEALRQLTDWLPKGPQADPDPSVIADSVLASAERSALVTLTHYSAEGSAEIAGASTDLILARRHGRLHLSPATRKTRPSSCLASGMAATSTTASPACDMTPRPGPGHGAGLRKPNSFGKI